jgi:hypothetical protein
MALAAAMLNASENNMNAKPEPDSTRESKDAVE